MKISNRTVDDLLTMVQHSRIDISYDAGGSFLDVKVKTDNKLDTKDVRKVERAIKFIEKIILERISNV